VLLPQHLEVTPKIKVIPELRLLRCELLQGILQSKAVTPHLFSASHENV
jgi:hypothetical protein